MQTDSFTMVVKNKTVKNNWFYLYWEFKQKQKIVNKIMKFFKSLVKWIMNFTSKFWIQFDDSFWCYISKNVLWDQ